MLFFLAAALCVAAQPRIVHSHTQLPVHGTIHKGTLYGFFGIPDNDFVLHTVSIDNPAKRQAKGYFVHWNDGAFYNYRHHIKFNSVWLSLGHTVLNRLKFDELCLYDSTNKDAREQYFKKYPDSFIQGTSHEMLTLDLHDKYWAEDHDVQTGYSTDVLGYGVVPTSESDCKCFFLAKKKQLEVWDVHFRWDEKIKLWKTKPSARFEKMGQWITDLNSSNFQKRATALVELEKLGDLAEPALKKLIKSNPNVETRRRAELLLAKLGEDESQSERLRPESDNYEKIPSLFNEDFYFFLRARDYYFVTKSGKLYVASARKEGEKSRKMKSLWDDTKRPIGAVIEDSDNDKVWLFAKDKNAGAKMALYFEMKDTIKTESFDPAKLRPVNVEGRAKTLLEYVPLIYAGANK